MTKYGVDWDTILDCKEIKIFENINEIKRWRGGGRRESKIERGSEHK